MNALQRWWYHYNTEITWFLIGWLSLDLIQEFARGNLPGMVFDAALIALNYYLNLKLY